MSARSGATSSVDLGGFCGFRDGAWSRIVQAAGMLPSREKCLTSSTIDARTATPDGLAVAPWWERSREKMPA
jgi:hypothetical protein